MLVKGLQVSTQDMDGYLTYIGTFRTAFQNKETLKSQLQKVSIGQIEGDIDRQVERLLAPDSSFEFLRYIAQIASNNLFVDSQAVNALKWMRVQSDSLLKKMFASSFPTLQASFDTLLRLSVEWRDASCFMLLSRCVPKSWLVGRRLGQILLSALELEVDDIASKILSTDIDVKSCLFTSRGDLGERVTYLGAVRSANIAKLILEKGADVNETSWNRSIDCYCTPIYHALLRGNTAVAEILLDYSADFDPNFVPRDLKSKTTLLGNAINQQDAYTVKWLLAKGAQCQDEIQEFDYRDRYKRTELQQAVVLGDIEILSNLLVGETTRVLLRLGVYKAAPLLEAAARGKVEMVKMLIKAGADVSAEMMDDEWDHDFDITPVGHEGWNALETALLCGHSGIAFVLLKAGAGGPLDHSICELYECGRRGDKGKAQCLIDIGIGAAHLLDALPTNVPQDQARVLATNIVLTFLEVCAESNVTGPKYGKSALCIAVEVGEWELAQSLVRRGADMDTWVPGRGPILQILLTYWHNHRGTPINETNDVEQVLKMMEVMLSAGADPDELVEINDHNADTVLELALRWGKGHASELARLLLGHGARVDGDENVLLAAIRAHCDIDVIRRLLDDGAVVDPRLSFYNPLQAAIGELKNDEWPSAVDVINLLLERGADVNAPPAESYHSDTLASTALGVAAGIGNLDVVKILLQKGADVNAPCTRTYCSTALQAAARYGHAEIVRLLLSCGAHDRDPALEGCNTALENAAWAGELEIAHLLLVSRAHVNGLGQSGSEALRGAIFVGNLTMAHMLLESGADPNATVYDCSALHSAAKYGKLDMIQLLLNSGAVPSKSTVNIAEEHGRLAIADFLREEIRKRKHGDICVGEEAGKAADQQIIYDNDSDLSSVPTVVLDLSEPRRILEVENHDMEANVDQDQEGWLFGLENPDWAAIEVLDMDE